MMLRMSRRVWILFGLVFFPITVVWAEEVRIAVASNFLSTLHVIASNFERDTGHVVVISSGSSGKLYAQIQHGAPFDMFFSADVERPKLMEEEGLAVPGSRFTYAVGRLTLWSADPNLVNGDGQSVLSTRRFEHVAIANPKTAPYGAAAKNALEHLGLWSEVEPRIVQGENIGQAFQFVYSQNAELGFVALSQVLDAKIKGAGSRWDIPFNLYEPLRQQAVILAHAQHLEVAKEFLVYMKGIQARNIIERLGYGVE